MINNKENIGINKEDVEEGEEEKYRYLQKEGKYYAEEGEE